MKQPKDLFEKPAVKPLPPSPDECCGGGCVPCIYDYYYEALAEWEQKNATNASTEPPESPSG